MITYIIVEEINDEILDVYNQHIVFIPNETTLTLNREGWITYIDKDIALSELSILVHSNINSLRSVGCDIPSITDYAKSYHVWECEVLDHSIIDKNTITVKSKLVKLINKVGGNNENF